MIKNDVISICNILADKMSESGKVAVQQIVAAIEDMEEEPCDDCISRKRLLSRIDAERKHLLDIKMDGAEHIIVHHARRIIEDMPSVTPTRPKGKWIHWTDDYKDYVTCSCCGYGEEGEVLLSDKTPFCPICGADMREMEDDEDSD